MTNADSSPLRCVTMRYAGEEGAPPEDVHFAFTLEEWATLTDFVVFATELRTASLLNRKRTTGFRLAGEGDQTLSDATQAEVTELAMYLRPFFLNDEPTAFARAANLLAKATTSTEVREILAIQRRVFAGETAQRLYALKVNGEDVNSEGALRNWLNGYVFHRDKDKRAALECLGESMDIARGEFVEMLVDKAVAVLQLAEFVAHLQAAESPGSPHES